MVTIQEQSTRVLATTNPVTVREQSVRVLAGPNPVLVTEQSVRVIATDVQLLPQGLYWLDHNFAWRKII